jgi:homoserine dehydrogenase
MHPHATRIVFLGFGNVGRALARLLLAKREAVRDEYGIEWRVVGIATRRHGAAIDPGGLDLQTALARSEGGGGLEDLSSQPAPADGPPFVRACPADVLFESIPVNYETGQPAVDCLQAALESGMHAITANKGPVVHAFDRLSALATAHGRSFLFESAVMDGAPVFSLWRQTLPAARLLSFRGILNSTTNLILTLMEQGRTFDQALAHAQHIGIAETDPSGDIQGWDAAVKVSALATVLMGRALKPSQVERRGIDQLTPDEIRAALDDGLRWKLVCRAEQTDGGLRASVLPERVGPPDPLYSVMGTSSAITFHSDMLPELTIIEGSPSTTTTAYGMMSDFIHACGVRSGRAR